MGKTKEEQMGELRARVEGGKFRIGAGTLVGWRGPFLSLRKLFICFWLSGIFCLKIILGVNEADRGEGRQGDPLTKTIIAQSFYITRGRHFRRSPPDCGINYQLIRIIMVAFAGRNIFSGPFPEKVPIRSVLLKYASQPPRPGLTSRLSQEVTDG
jgi:hypothetical protein